MITENLPDSDAERSYELQADSIKADIDLKDKDETILAKLKYRIKVSEDNRKDKDLSWEKNLKFFEGKHNEIVGERIPGYKAKTVVNKWFSAVRSLIAFETDAKPETEVEVCIDQRDPNVDILYAQAKKVDQALDYNWDLLGIQNTVTEILYDRYNYADGFGMYFWDAEIDNVNFEQIKPQELLVSPGATCIDDAEFLILCRYRNKKWFDKNYPDAEVSYEDKRDLLDNTYRNTSQYFNMAKVYYYLEDEFWVIFTEKEILDKMPNPYWEWRDDEEQQKEMIGQYGTIPPDWKPIHNHLRKPEKPIIHFKGYHLGGDFYSQDLAKQAMELNFAFNKRKCQIQDNADFANGQIFVDPSVPEEKRRLITSKPGLVIGINPSMVNRVAGTPLPEFVFADMQHTEQKFDDILGHHDVSKGAATTKRQTRTEVLMLKESDITPVRLMMRNTEQAMTKLLNGWVQLMKLFYDNQHYVGSFSGEVNPLRTTISRDDIPDNLSIIIKVGSTIPVSKEARRMEYERWTMSGMMDLLSFYEKMGEPNPEKLANRAMNARMGVLSDTPPQPPMPQGQPIQGGQPNA